MSASPAMQSPPVDLVGAALAYAEKGLPVFPCDPATKQPFTGHGFKNASNDPATVRKWWERYPDAMIGIPTGEASNAWVLDVDDPAIFEGTGFDLPATRRCETGKGYHLYFRHDPTVRNSQVVRKDGEKRWPFPNLPGAEVRGEGGYVIVPPSLHPSGRRYAWSADIPIVEAPASLLRIVRKEHVERSSTKPDGDGQDTAWGLAALSAECANVKSAGDGEQEGTLNGAALKIGGIVAGGGLSLSTARRELIAAGLAMPSFNPRDQWTPQGVVAKIERGLSDGAANPRAPAERMRFGPRPASGPFERAREGQSHAGEDYDPETGEVSPWPAPVDLWQHYSAPALPVGLLPEVIERFARKHGEVMGADPAGLAMAALTVCATAISDNIALQVKRNDPTWKESARLWVALVGPPSRKKSPIFKAAMRPLRRLDTNLMSAYLAKLRTYEALPNDQRKAAPRPLQKRLLISDATIEAAQEVMKDSPDGILSEQDELSGWFGSMDKYSSGKGPQAERAFWLKAFNGGTYNLNRISRGAVQIPNLSINLLGGIQPEPLRKIANDTVDDGLIQRLLPVILRPASVGRDVPADGVIAEYERLIESLNLMQPPHSGVIASDNHQRAVPVRFDDRARTIRERLEVEHLALVEALETVSPVNGGRIPVQRGGVKAGQ